MIVKPFRGLRPRADLASRIPSPAYDTLDSNEARALARGDPYTFLHVVKPEIDLDPAIDPHDDRVYAKGRENLHAMIAEGWLTRDPRPAYYVYRQVQGDHVQTGIVGAAAASDYRDGRIKKHEHTRPDKVRDRARHAEALGGHPGPLFLAYRDDETLDRIAEEISGRAPAADFVADDGVRHTLWSADDPGERDRIEGAFAGVPCTYVADGHHRTAAYASLAEDPRPGEGGRERFLAVHFPASGLRILDYNRLVRDLRGLDAGTFVRRVGEAGFEVDAGSPDGRPAGRGTFGMYLAGRWYRLTARPGTIPDRDPIGSLDVSVLSDRILSPLLGIEDPRTDDRIGFVGGGRGTAELARRVDSAGHAVAFALFPTRMEDVMSAADAGLVMPPKSTWFEPKLRSGMVVHLFADEAGTR